jgi:hypothetical protein
MAFSLQQLVEMIRQRGADRDAKRVDEAFAALDSVVKGFGQDFGSMPITLKTDPTVTLRTVLNAISDDLKAKRLIFAQKDIIDQALAALEKELST